MAKQKKSFFERVTGIKKIEEEEEQEIHMSSNQPQTQNFFSEYQEEEMYEFPEINQPRPQQQFYREEPMQPASQTNESIVSESEGQLTIDVYQTDEEIVIKSTIAGVKPEDLDVNINNDMVTIRGERKLDEQVDAENYYYQECYWGLFSRSVILPVEIIAEKAEAAMKNGILTIRLPKADTTKSRRIQVRGY